jgi:hypothetical protein
MQIGQSEVTDRVSGASSPHIEEPLGTSVIVHCSTKTIGWPLNPAARLEDLGGTIPRRVAWPMRSLSECNAAETGAMNRFSRVAIADPGVPVSCCRD